MKEYKDDVYAFDLKTLWRRFEFTHRNNHSGINGGKRGVRLIIIL